MDRLIYAQDVELPLCYKGYSNVREQYDNLLHFSRCLESLHIADIVIYHSALPFSTEMNYRCMFVNFMQYVNRGGEGIYNR